MIFLIVVDGLGREIISPKDCGVFHGISFRNDISLSRVIFVDVIVMVTDGSKESLSSLYEVLLEFCEASRMKINEEKYTLYHFVLDEYEIITLHNIFSFLVVKLENGKTYLGFHLKPCRYLLKY